MKLTESEWYSANTGVRTQYFANNFHEISALVRDLSMRKWYVRLEKYHWKQPTSLKLEVLRSSNGLSLANVDRPASHTALL